MQWILWLFGVGIVLRMLRMRGKWNPADEGIRPAKGSTWESPFEGAQGGGNEPQEVPRVVPSPRGFRVLGGRKPSAKLVEPFPGWSDELDSITKREEPVISTPSNTPVREKYQSRHYRYAVL